MPTQALINSLAVATFGASLAFLAAWFWHQKNRALATAASIKQGHDELVRKVYELERKQHVIEAAVVPITTTFQQLLIKSLTHPHFHAKEMDALMKKIGPPNSFDEGEEKRLSILLRQRAEDTQFDIPDEERIAARILPDVMTLAKIQQDRIDSESVIAVVAVPRDIADGMSGILPGQAALAKDAS
jgi:hypothetical protein